MPTRPRLVRSIPFWGLVLVSIATAVAGALLLVDKLGSMTTTLTDGSATGVDVYVGQSIAVARRHPARRRRSSASLLALAVATAARPPSGRAGRGRRPDRLDRRRAPSRPRRARGRRSTPSRPIEPRRGRALRSPLTPLPHGNEETRTSPSESAGLCLAVGVPRRIRRAAAGRSRSRRTAASGT